MKTITPDLFGRDHLSTLLYLEARAVDHSGRPNMANLKCNANRHPFPANGKWDPKYNTKLADGTAVDGHDDWDCIEDMVAAGWLRWEGTGASPVFVLTDAGWAKAHELRRGRAERALTKQAA